MLTLARPENFKFDKGRMRFLFVSLVLIFLGTSAVAQKNGKTRQQEIDSLTQKLHEDSAFIFRPKYSKPYLRVENRYSFISKKPVNLIGFMAGVVYKDKHIFCAGYYTLNRFKQKSLEFVDANNITRREYLILNYFIGCYQYVILNNKYLQINIPLEVGYGLFSTQTTDNLETHFKKSNGYIVPISAGFQAKFKIVKWAGISVVGGYRHVVQERDIDLEFRGFYYSFGVWVDARHVTRHLKYHFKKKRYHTAIKELD